MKLMTALVATLVALTALSGCAGDDDESVPTDEPTRSPSGTGDVVVTWDEFVELLESCDVAVVGQAHSLDVGLTTEDGRSFTSKEPEIDDVFEVVDGLEEDCRPGQMYTE